MLASSLVEAKTLVVRSCTPIAIASSDSGDEFMRDAPKQHRTIGSHVPTTSSNVAEHLSLDDLFFENDGAGVSSAHGPEVCETPLGSGGFCDHHLPASPWQWGIRCVWGPGTQ